MQLTVIRVQPPGSALCHLLLLPKTAARISSRFSVTDSFLNLPFFNSMVSPSPGCHVRERSSWYSTTLNLPDKCFQWSRTMEFLRDVLGQIMSKANWRQELLSATCPRWLGFAPCSQSIEQHKKKPIISLVKWFANFLDNNEALRSWECCALIKVFGLHKFFAQTACQICSASEKSKDSWFVKVKQVEWKLFPCLLTDCPRKTALPKSIHL